MNHAPENDPVLALVRQHMEREGIDRRTLGERLAGGGDLAKALRRVDELLQGERLRPAVLERVVVALGIPPSHLEVALEASEGARSEDEREAARHQAEATMERRGPHLWGRLPENYHPSLVTVLGPEFWLLVPVPREVLDLPDYEQMAEVGRIARDHYQNHRRCRLVGYDYRRSLHEVFRFGPEGDFLGRIASDLCGGGSFVRIGGREIDTTEGRLLRGRESGEG